MLQAEPMDLKIARGNRFLDCADGNTEWVALNTDGKTKKVTFAFGKAPEFSTKL